jgi:uncharacterized protein (DUF305 family)
MIRKRLKCLLLSRKVIFTLLIITISILSFQVLAEDVHHGHAIKTPATGPFVVSSDKPFETLMDEAMSIMHRDMEQALRNGDPDHDFVTMMIPHHQGAIDMAKVLLLYGKNAELRNLGKGIITAQENEIKIMQEWLRKYKPEKPLKSEPFAALMEKADITMHSGMEQSQRNGDSDHDFVTMMIPHHQGAIDMAKALLKYGKDIALRKLAQQIITEQQYEIQLMQAWLKSYKSLK